MLQKPRSRAAQSLLKIQEACRGPFERLWTLPLKPRPRRRHSSSRERRRRPRCRRRCSRQSRSWRREEVSLKRRPCCRPLYAARTLPPPRQSFTVARATQDPPALLDPDGDGSRPSRRLRGGGGEGEAECGESARKGLVRGGHAGEAQRDIRLRPTIIICPNGAPSAREDSQRP